jgi:RNA polymerase sigma-70 factor, ECF subfamily
LDYSAVSPEELVLTCLRTGDEEAWVEFVRRFQPLIARIVLRVARQWGEASPQLIDDLVQETYLKLCADREGLARNFKSNHQDAIYAYIKVFAANLAHDHCKASHSKKRGGSALLTSLDDETVGPKPQPVTFVEANLDRALLIQQIEDCLQVITSGPTSRRDRLIFWMYYRAGIAASSIASLPTIGMTTKGVESTIQRLTRRVRERFVSLRTRASHDGPSEGIQPSDSL